MRNGLPNLEDFHTFVFDFDGVFTNNKVIVSDVGSESVVCDRADGLAFDFIRSFNAKRLVKLECFILSKEPNPVVLSRAKKLKLKCYHGVQNKLLFMQNYFMQNMPDLIDPFSGMIYFGNDLNDLPMMSVAGYSVSPSDAHPLVLSQANYVSSKEGGNGCIREFVEKALKLDLLTREELHEFISNS